MTSRSNTRKPRKLLTPTQLHILMALADGKRHGYAIKQEVERRTEGALNLGPATLYDAIQRTRHVAMRETRPALLTVLEHDDPRARQETVLALAKMQPPPDVQKLLEVVLALPEPYAFLAAEAFVLLAVPCAIEPLEDYVAAMKDLKLQAKFRYLVERLRRVTTAARRLEEGRG